MIETQAPDYVTARHVGKPISILAVNETQGTWFGFICRPRAYWVAGRRLTQGGVTTDDFLRLDVFPGGAALFLVLVPRLPRHARPAALRVVVLEEGVAEHIVCDIPYR